MNRRGIEFFFFLLFYFIFVIFFFTNFCEDQWKKRREKRKKPIHCIWFFVFCKDSKRKIKMKIIFSSCLCLKIQFMFVNFFFVNFKFSVSIRLAKKQNGKVSQNVWMFVWIKNFLETKWKKEKPLKIECLFDVEKNDESFQLEIIKSFDLKNSNQMSVFLNFYNHSNRTNHLLI